MKALPLAFGALLLMAQAAAGFTIGDQPFAQSEILDARAMPELDGTASIMLTLDPKAAARLGTLTQKNVGKTLSVTLDGKQIAAPKLLEPITAGVLTITGRYTLAEAETLAKRISGKDPVPEEFED